MTGEKDLYYDQPNGSEKIPSIWNNIQRWVHDHRKEKPIQLPLLDGYEDLVDSEEDQVLLVFKREEDQLLKDIQSANLDCRPPDRVALQWGEVRAKTLHRISAILETDPPSYTKSLDGNGPFWEKMEDFQTEFMIRSAFDWGKTMLIIDLIQQLRGFARNNGFLDTAQRYVTLLEFCYAGIAIVSKNGVSVPDLVAQKKQDGSSKARLLAFVLNNLGSDLSWDDREEEQVLCQSNPMITESYPHLVGSEIHSMESNLRSIFIVKPAAFDKYRKSASEVELQIIKRTQELLTCVAKFKKEVAKVLFNPQDPEWDHLRDFFENYLRSEKVDYSALLPFFGQDDSEEDSQPYRKARKLATEMKEQGEFFKLFAKAYLRSIKSTFFYSSAIMVDELDQVTRDNGPLPPIDEPKLWQEQRRLAQEIAESTKTRTFFVPIDQIETPLPLFIHPESIEVSLGPRPQKFEVTLQYRNQETEESLDITFYVDASKDKQTVEWSVFESINDLQCRNKFYLPCLCIAHDALEQIHGQIKKERKSSETRSSSAICPSPSVTPRPKAHTIDEIYKLRKEVRQGISVDTEEEPKAMTSLVNFDMPKLEIVPLTEEELTEFMPTKKYSEEERELIGQAIESFNNRPSALDSNLKGIRSRRGFFRYRVGNMRVLLGLNEEGKLEVWKVGLRKDVYTKH